MEEMKKKYVSTAKSSKNLSYVLSLKREINCLRHTEVSVAQALVVFSMFHKTVIQKKWKEYANRVVKIRFLTKELI